MDKIFYKIFFDFDSTLIKIESLNLLGEKLGVGKEVQKMTELSMNGKVPFEKVLEKKMDMIHPSLSSIKKLSSECKDLLVEDLPEVIKALHSFGKKIFILSANFHHIIDPVAKILKIPLKQVLANDLTFDEHGNYLGINKTTFFCSNSERVKLLRKNLKKGEHSVFVGDSVTDLACKNVVDLFVGFGGVAERLAVKKQADKYFRSKSIVPLLLMVLRPFEIAALRKKGFAKLLNKAEKLAAATKNS